MQNEGSVYVGKQKTKSEKARTVLRLLAQPIMNMGTKENTKKAFALMMSTVMLAATGCEAIEISSKKAEQIVVHNLEEKYGGTFEVRSVEKKE